MEFVSNTRSAGDLELLCIVACCFYHFHSFSICFYLQLGYRFCYAEHGVCNSTWVVCFFVFVDAGK